MALDTAELLHPVTADSPCGEDASFSDQFDQIRDARRADDPSLSQGDWQTELKVADWRAVISLASDVLTGQSKDLQVAAWLGEALIGRHGFDGAADAFTVLHGLLDTYWDGLFPLPDGDDLEERASKLAWFNSWGTTALKRAPLSAGNPYVALVDWQSSREVDNLARQNADAHQAALAEGKTTGEAFDRQVQDSGSEFVRTTLAAVEAAQVAFDRLQTLVDARFGRQAPSMAELGEALKRARQIMAKAGVQFGIGTASAADTALEDPPAKAVATPAQATGIRAPTIRPAGDGADKAELLRTITDIAAHFKRLEPHSPVPFLLERAVAWANTPLDQWLAEVISDDSVLNGIRDRIGAPR
jgi:type VI secretion system protein ImpA